MLAALLAMSAAAGAVSPAAEIWVSPEGSDANAGTREKPLRTPATALRKGRELRRMADASTAGGVKIVLRGGVYEMAETLRVRSEDAGTERAPTVFEAAKGERPVLSGGVSITGWRNPGGDEGAKFPSVTRGNVWVADVPVFQGLAANLRQIWVGDRKAVRARAQNGDDMERLLAWDRVKEEATVRAAALLGLSDAGGKLAGLEMLILQQWEIAILRVKSVRVDGEKAVLTFHSPESRIEFEHPWPQPSMKEGNHAPFFLSGAAEFLDQPGEWWTDANAGKVYYWPRESEDLVKTRVVASALETLVNVEGSLERPVAHVVG
jgi:hypothetical protein